MTLVPCRWFRAFAIAFRLSFRAVAVASRSVSRILPAGWRAGGLVGRRVGVVVAVNGHAHRPAMIKKFAR